MVEREYSYGIYMFIDIQNGEVVYIGLDSHIDRRERIKAHYQQSQYDKQKFNKILQNNPDRFKPFIYWKCDTWEEMCQLEFDLINLYRPRFNYRHGGDGSFINKEFKYTIAKAGFSTGGKQQYQIYDMDNKNLITSIDFEFLQDICLKLNNNELTPDEVKNINKEFEYTVAKAGFGRNGKQKYTIYDINHKPLKRSIDFEFIQDICLKLNNNELTEEEVKNINSNIK